MIPALLNGQAPDGSLAWSRALHYGDGIFRTLLRWQGEWCDWSLQMEKLASDCQQLGLQPPPELLLRQEAAQLCKEHGDAVLKIMCMRSAETRGYAATTSGCDRLLIRYELPAFSRRTWEQGISAGRSAVVMAPQPRLAGIKHLNRLEQVLASTDGAVGSEEMLLCDAEGHLVSGSRSNLFWVRGGALCTPALERCGVAGMMRGKLLALAPALGIPVTQGHWPWSELEGADEIFVCNSLVGIWPLRQLEQKLLAAPGRVTATLSAALRHPQAVRA